MPMWTAVAAIIATSAGVPSVTVFLVTVAHARQWRWRETAIAAGVLVILALSVAIRPH